MHHEFETAIPIHCFISESREKLLKQCLWLMLQNAETLLRLHQADANRQSHKPATHRNTQVKTEMPNSSFMKT